MSSAPPANKNVEQLKKPSVKKRNSLWMKQKEKEEARANKKRTYTEQQKIMYLYWQSVFVWNLPFHFYSYVLLTYLVLFYGIDQLVKLNAFQVLGGGLILITLLPPLFRLVNQRVSLAEKPAVKKPSAAKRAASSSGITNEPQVKLEQNSRMFWPQDATALSADRNPLNGQLLFGKVKLYDWDQLLKIVMGFEESLRQGVYSVRVLRYSNPTQFTFVVLLLCCWGYLIGAYIAGKTLVICTVLTAMFLPGLLRRNIFFKLRRKLEGIKALRMILDQIIVDQNPNLDETNTQKVMSFVTDTDTSTQGGKKVLTKAAA